MVDIKNEMCYHVRRGDQMGTKEQLLTLLEKNRGTYFSGEDIAERL